MLDVYEKLFDLYGDAILRNNECYSEDEINKFLDTIPIDARTRIQFHDFAFRLYYRWSTNAFTLGMHLGLSLLNDQIGGFRPQKGQ